MKRQVFFLKLRMTYNRLRKRTHRILFLDFDGVVNIPYQYGTAEYEDAMARGVYDFFRPEIVERLNHLILGYQLSIVVSSSWRYEGIEFCKRSLYEAGFDSSIVIEGITPAGDDYPPRHTEIISYLRSVTDVSAFLILDDIYMHELAPYAVQTDFDIGYDEICDRKARSILESQIHSLL